jgi:hypothetical protein
VTSEEKEPVMPTQIPRRFDENAGMTTSAPAWKIPLENWDATISPPAQS